MRSNIRTCKTMHTVLWRNRCFRSSYQDTFSCPASCLDGTARRIQRTYPNLVVRQTPAEIEEITHNHTHTTTVRGLVELMLVLGRILSCMAGTGIQQISIKEMIHAIINDMFSVNCQLPFPRIYRESVKQNFFGTSGVDPDMPKVGYLSKHTAGTPYDSHRAQRS